MEGEKLFIVHIQQLQGGYGNWMAMIYRGDDFVMNILRKSYSDASRWAEENMNRLLLEQIRGG